MTPRARLQRERTFTILGARAHAKLLPAGLHIVATPIGNLGDVTMRALETLAAADVILAEDTRISRRLLEHYMISTPLAPYHEHNASEARPRAIQRMVEGEALALISDAGTPLISDPGYKLVTEAADRGLFVSTLPGPCAAIAALTVSGLPTDRFLFEGFLPTRTSARRDRLNELSSIPATLVFYEGPSRIAETLADLAAEFGSRPAAVARELTKMHEEVRRDDLVKLAAYYSSAEDARGEFVIVTGPPTVAAETEDATVDQAIVEALTELSVKDAAAVVSARYRLPRREIYARALHLAAVRR